MQISHIRTLSNYSALVNHPCYQSAHSGNLHAAQSLISDILTPAVMVSGAEMNATIIPVLKSSGNRIPLALAQWLASHRHCERSRTTVMVSEVEPCHGERSRTTVCTDIILQNSRPGNAMIRRMSYKPVYTGSVPHGNYILVDDVFTTGITLKALKSYIESQGSRVIAIYTLACARHTNFEAPASLLATLQKKFPAITNYFRLDSLTWAQASYLLMFSSLSNFIRQYVSLPV